MAITLHPDQSEAVGRIRGALKDHQSVLLQAACGFGKTVVAAYIAQGAQQKQKRVVFAAHRRELVRQTMNTFENFGIEYGLIMAGERSNPLASVQIASADSLRNRPHLIPCDLFVPDEAHLWGDGTRAEIIDLARRHGNRIVPLTATPQRGDGRPMSRIADIIVSGPSVRSLIDAGRLAQYKVYAPSRPDLSKVHTRAGEYVTSEVDDIMGRPAVIADAVRYYRQFADGLRMIGYAPSRARGNEYAQQFTDAGIPAAFLDGETPDDIRQSTIRAFADGGLSVLFNCQLFREGFDLSAQVKRHVPIQAVGLYNPTQSLPLAIQMMMRGMRPQDGTSIILDHAGIIVNHMGMINHGFPDDEREWTLDGIVRRGANGERTISSVTCKKCAGTFRPRPTCPYCGAERDIESREVTEIEGHLAELDPETARLQADLARRRKEFAKQEEGRAKTLADLVKLGVERGYKMPAWAVMRLRQRGVEVTSATWREAAKIMEGLRH